MVSAWGSNVGGLPGLPQKSWRKPSESSCCRWGNYRVWNKPKYLLNFAWVDLERAYVTNPFQLTILNRWCPMIWHRPDDKCIQFTCDTAIDWMVDDHFFLWKGSICFSYKTVLFGVHVFCQKPAVRLTQVWKSPNLRVPRNDVLTRLASITKQSLYQVYVTNCGTRW